MEIGGYLEYEKYHGPEYHTNCLKINTARNCLKYLIEARKIKKIWLSKWNCPAVINTCNECGIQVEYYDLDTELKPIIPLEYKTDDYLYIVNYYGQLTEVTGEHIILDNVQAFFQKPLSGVDTIYTCRKFFGVTDGAYLYTNSRIERELQTDISYSRINYLAGRMERSASEFYSDYKENEKRLDSLPLKKMSLLTENILRSLDYEYIKKTREENFAYLHKAIGKYNQLSVKPPIGPFAYPFMVSNGDEIREKLQTQQIYIAKLWPNVIQSQERVFADNILPIPCDQRYGFEEIDRIVEAILKCLKH